MFQRQKINGPYHFYGAGVTDKAALGTTGVASVLFIRHFKTFLQEEDETGLRNDSLFNVVRSHGTQAEMLSAPIQTAGQV